LRVVTPSGKRTIYVRDEQLWQRVTDYAAQTHQSASQIISAALRAHLLALADHPDPTMRPRPPRKES
jgi:hypothetical protein